MDYRPLDLLTLEEYERVEDRYRQWRKCIHCRELFLEAENIGQLRCRLHPGVRQFDLYRSDEYYTCCGGESGSVGCIAADHCGDDLCETDEKERHEALFEMAFAVVPCGLFQYGLMPPMPSTTVFDSQRCNKRRRVCVAASFNQTMEEEFDLDEVAHDVSESVKDSPVLMRTLPRETRERLGQQCSRSEAIRRLEAGWPSDFDNDSDTADRKRLHKPDYTLPYLIVKRIY